MLSQRSFLRRPLLLGWYGFTALRVPFSLPEK